MPEPEKPPYDFGYKDCNGAPIDLGDELVDPKYNPDARIIVTGIGDNWVRLSRFNMPGNNGYVVNLGHDALIATGWTKKTGDDDEQD